MTNWQFIGFVIAMAGTLFGTLYWATAVLERRVDRMEKHVDERFTQVEKRFDDLKQIVQAQQKQPSPPQR